MYVLKFLVVFLFLILFCINKRKRVKPFLPMRLHYPTLAQQGWQSLLAQHRQAKKGAYKGQGPTHRCAKREKKHDHGTYNHPCSCFYNVKTKKEREKNNTFQLTKRGVQYRPFFLKKKASKKKPLGQYSLFTTLFLLLLKSSWSFFNKPKGSYPTLLKSSWSFFNKKG